MKKPSVVSFLFTLLLAAALCTHGKEYVTDKDGNPVKLGHVGGQYFIEPVKSKHNNGGGLVPAATNILPFCRITLNAYKLPGVPVSFEFPHSTMENYALLNYPVNIEFKSDIGPVCDEYSKFWKVDDSSSAILIGGKQEDKNSWFKIEKPGLGAEANTYKLSTLTGTVGAIPGDKYGAPELVVNTNDNAETLLVTFVKKVDDTTTTTTSTSQVEKLRLRMFPFY